MAPTCLFLSHTVWSAPAYSLHFVLTKELGGWKWLAFGAFLGISPDFDFALNWLGISIGGWHHGFTHSIPFAVVVGLATIVVLRQWKARSFFVFSTTYVSHTLLDYMLRLKIDVTYMRNDCR